MGGDEGANDGDQVESKNNDENRVIQDISPSVATVEPLEFGSLEEFDASLPETVCLLPGPYGSRLYLVGTAHFSRESQDDVSRVIRTVSPQAIVVELCSSRANILKMDEEAIVEEAKNLSFQKMRAIIKEEGTVQGLMNILILNLSAQLTKDLGMAPGGEFRRAFAEYQMLRKNSPCLFHFGDRPIQITLRRALEVLSWWERIRLSYSLVFQSPSISQEEVEKYKQTDLLESMLKDLGSEFPELGKVFIEERDIYLTYSMQLACNIQVENATTERPIVVGVVGMGHVPGIKSLWGTVGEYQIPPIMTLRESKPKGRGLFNKVLIGGFFTYVAIKLVRRFLPSPRKFGFKL